jgi:hypothetical protein
MYQKRPYQKGLFFSRFSRSAKPHIRQRIGVKWKFQVVRRARFSRKLAPDNYSQAINPHFRNSVLTEMHTLNLFLCSSGSSMKYVHNHQRGQNSIRSYGHTELKYGFCKKSLWKDEPLTSWTLFWAYLSSSLGGCNRKPTHLSEVTSYKIHTYRTIFYFQV